ncbi:putative ribonuclease H-like domain-containing protein [Tanacetum coccineum]
MCDKKNSVLFTETECLVLSPDFKLLDESQVLLKVPRHNNMYSFDLKNVVPSGGLTCLFAKATIDESNLWHRRLGHINFKTMNKLVRGNLVRDSLLPTTFWAEAVSTACYVQNRVLVTKPHNKTPYELLHGRPPSISFMRPFGCPVTILNTLDPLGKFDEKADEGFFVGYSINSKAFRVFNTRTRKVEENLHKNFLENKPNVVGSRPDWLFDIDLLTNSMNYKPVTTGNQTNRNAGIKDNVDAVPTQQYILLPLLYDSPQSSKDAVIDDAGKKNNEEPANNGERNGQEKEGGASNKEVDQNVQDFRAALDNLLVQQKKGYANNTNRDITVSPSVSTAGQSFTNADDLPTDPLMPDLKDTADLLNTGIFSGAYDDEDEGVEADLNNLETTMNVSPIPTTRIHKDHPKNQLIRDINSATQTRRMTKISEEHAMMDPKGCEKVHFFIWSTKKSLCVEFEQMMHKRFQMSSMEELTVFLRLQTTSTPIETNKALLKDEEAKDMDVHLYRSMIGSLMYLTASRPDIMFTVCACEGDSPFDLEAFSDSEYAGASLDRKSTIGDETVYKEWEDRMERATITAFSLEAEQDSGNMNRTQSIAILNDSFPHGTDSGGGPRCQDTILGGAEAQIRLNLLMHVLVYAARHSLTAVRHKLMLPGITSYYWTSATAKTVNGERQIQALVDKKKVIITETSIRSDLKLDDAEGTDCLPTATIFAELERMGYENVTQKLTFYKAYFSSQWKFLIHTILQCLSAKTTSWNEFSSTMASAIICLATNQKFNFSKYIFDNMVKNLEGGVKFLMYPRFVQVFLDKQVEGMSRHKGIYVIPSHTKKVFANMKRPGKGFSGKVTPLFETMMVQATEDMGEDSAAPTDSHSTPIHTQPSSSKPQKKKSRRKQRKDSGPTEPIPDEAINEEHVATPSCDPPQSVLALETTKSNQALEIKSLKRRVQSLENRKKSRTPGFKRLRKVGSASRVLSSNDVSLGAQEDASKQGRKITDLNTDA